MPKDVLSNGGDKSKSSHYQMVATVGQHATRKGTANGNVLYSGFYAPRSTRSPKPNSACGGVTEGLVACYLFDGDAKDGSGNGNHGTVHGATLTEDRFGNADSAYSFDRSNSYIQSNISVDLAQGMSYSTWVFVQGREKSHANLISINGRSFSFFQYLGNHIELCMGNCLGHHPIKSVKDNQWQHFVITLNSNVAQIFLNSELVKTLEVSSVLQKFDNVSLYLGGEGGTDYNLTGKMDDVRIYNRALSESEIQQLYKVEE
jgi:hypothetical protein